MINLLRNAADAAATRERPRPRERSATEIGMRPSAPCSSSRVRAWPSFSSDFWPKPFSARIFCSLTARLRSSSVLATGTSWNGGHSIGIVSPASL